VKTMAVRASGRRALLPAPLNAVPDLTGVGSEEFIAKTRAKLGIRAKGRRVRGHEEAYELREPSALYGGHFGAKNDDIGPENTYYWNNYD